MIILNLVVYNEEQIDDLVKNVLINKWALNVIVGKALDSYYLGDTTIMHHARAYLIQFVTKSLLFSEIETTIKNKFPAMDFIIYAAPAAHIDTCNYHKIKNGVIGCTLPKKELLHQ